MEGNAIPSMLNSTNLLHQIWQRRITFALVFVASSVAIVGALIVLPKHYYAPGVVTIGADPSQGIDPVSWQQRVNDAADLESNLIAIVSPKLVRLVVASPTASSSIKTECVVVRSELLDRIIARLTTNHLGCDEIVSSDAHKLDWVTHRYSATAIGSRLIEIGYVSPSPVIAQSMTNALINVYLDDERAKRLEPRQAGVAWLHQQLIQLSTALKHDETSIQELRKSHGLHGQYASVISTELTEAFKLLAQAKAKQAEAAAELNELKHSDGTDIAPVLLSRTIDSLKQQLTTVTVELAGLSQRVSANSPQLTPLLRERSEVQVRLDLETVRLQNSIRHTYDAATAQVTTLTEDVEKLKQDAGEASDYESQIASMVRDAETKRALYVELSKRATQLETEREVSSAGSRLINLAEIPNEAFPKTVPFLVGGLALAALLAALASLRWEKYDLRVRDPETLEMLTSLPVLSRIPVIKRPFYGRLPLSKMLTQMQQPSMLQESIRRLYAQISLSELGQKANQILLVTSSDAHEGKSFVALGIAQFAKANGKRVLLIDCDLRKPSIQEALNLPPQNKAAGLSDYLCGKRNNATVTHLSAGFDVILAGEASIASTELLNGQRFSSLLTMMRKNYDLMVLDSPPSALLMDASVIAARTDGVVICSRYEHTRTDHILKSLKGMHDVGAKIIGFVFTFAPEHEHVPYGNESIYGQKRLAGTPKK